MNMFPGLYTPLPSIDKYLERIEMPRPEKLDKEYLNRLIYAHQTHVPFDTLDVGLLGKDISINIEDIYDKIVLRKRGGYCFEINGLFIKLVQELGYDAYCVPCRIMPTEDTVAPVFHRGSCVVLDGKKYYFDVGGGTMPPGIVEYKEDEWQDFGGEKFMMKRVGEYWYNLYRLSVDSELNNQPKIVLQAGIAEYKPVDYVAPNMMCGVGPNARFRDRANLNMRTKTGSVSLTGRELSIVDNHKKTTTLLEDDNEYMDAMIKIFGVDIREEFESLKK